MGFFDSIVNKYLNVDTFGNHVPFYLDYNNGDKNEDTLKMVEVFLRLIETLYTRQDLRDALSEFRPYFDVIPYQDKEDFKNGLRDELASLEDINGIFDDLANTTSSKDYEAEFYRKILEW